MTSTSVAVWTAQPACESNKHNKLCAQCEFKPAKLRCARCCCTRYCSRQCQQLHWKRAHKRQCKPDPLRAEGDARLLPLRAYRAFTDAERRTDGCFVVILDGPCPRQPLDDRDACCQLIARLPDEEFNVEVKADGAAAQGDDDAADRGDAADDGGRRSFEPTAAAAARMGWGEPCSRVALGWSVEEDALYYRVWFGAAPSAGGRAAAATAATEVATGAREPLDNLLADALLAPQYAGRGRVVVGKVRVTIQLDGEGSLLRRQEELVPCSVAEVVDVVAWRRYVGSAGMHSTRMHRENMRRGEAAAFVEQFKARSMQIPAGPAELPGRGAQSSSSGSGTASGAAATSLNIETFHLDRTG